VAHQQAEQHDGLRYRLYIPATATAESPVPLIVLLHGTSGRGQDNSNQFTAANKAAITFLLAQSNHPCAMIVPQCPPSQQWTRTTYHPEQHEQTPEPSQTMQQLIGVIQHLADQPSINRKRISVIGNSMGGYGTWDIAARAPQLFAAIVPICGGGDLRTVPQLSSLALWAFHGARDPIVNVGHSQRMVAAITKAGGKPRYQEFPEAGHDIADLVYLTPGLATWLFAQERP
jgi:predicted peptidase